jgi:hypothetical protein
MLEVVRFLSLQVEFKAVASQLKATRDCADRRLLAAKADKLIAEAKDLVAEAKELARRHKQRNEIPS